MFWVCNITFKLTFLQFNLNRSKLFKLRHHLTFCPYRDWWQTQLVTEISQTLPTLPDQTGVTDSVSGCLRRSWVSNNCYYFEQQPPPSFLNGLRCSLLSWCYQIAMALWEQEACNRMHLHMHLFREVIRLRQWVREWGGVSKPIICLTSGNSPKLFSL